MTEQYLYLTDTGEVSTDTADVLESVKNEFRAATRPNINLSAATPAGTLAAAEAIARTNVMKTAAERANVINPSLSFGTFLDAVCAFNGIPRRTNQSTIGRKAVIYGNSGVVVPAESAVRTSAGDVYRTLTDVRINTNGAVQVDIRSEAYGDIALPIGNMTIIDGTIGWGSIAVVDGQTVREPGTLRLTDPQLKNSRNARLSRQGMGNSAAIAAAVLGVPNVTSVSVVENNTGAAGLVNGVTFSLPNAFWVCVAGNATAASIAAALYDSHAGGCPWDFGATGNGRPVSSPAGVAVRDPVTGFTYYVKYTTPILYDTYVKVTYKQGTSSAAPNEAIQNVLLDYAKGNLEGEPGFVVGASVSAFELAGAISTVLPGLYVRKVEVACVLAGQPAPAPGAFSTEFVISPFQQAQLAVGNIQVITG